MGDDEIAVNGDGHKVRGERIHTQAMQVFRALVGKCFLPDRNDESPVPPQQTDTAAAVDSVWFEPSSTEAPKEEKGEEKKDLAPGAKPWAYLRKNLKSPTKPVAPPALQPPTLIRQRSSELKQQVLGLLFGSPSSSQQQEELSELQRMVFELVFSELRREVDVIVANGASLVLDKSAYDGADIKAAPLDAKSVPDTYCYDLSSMVAQLSVTETGQRFIASPYFMDVLFSLFPVGSPRVQRTVLRVLNRVLPFIDPDKLHNAGVLKSRHGVVVFFLAGIASSLETHLRGQDPTGVKYFKQLPVREAVRSLAQPLPKSVGLTCAQLLRKLFLLQTAENRATYSEDQMNLAIKWRKYIVAETKHVLESVTRSDADKALKGDEGLWLVLAALCVLAGEPKSENVVDKFKLEGWETGHIAIDCHDGNGRLKLLRPNGSTQTLLVANLAQAKALAEFRSVLGQGESVCRFCDTVLTDANRAKASKNVALNDVCNTKECLEHRKNACSKVLKCGHACCGVRDEPDCLPCLQSGCAVPEQKLGVDADEMCSICYCDTLGKQPSILLKCGHVFHYGCVRNLLTFRWQGARISFSFTCCPLCKKKMDHPSIMDLKEPLDKMEADMNSKALMRMQYEGKDKIDDVVKPDGAYYNDPLGWALHNYMYYLCFKCQKPYYGGEYHCVAGMDQIPVDPSELMCGACSPVTKEDCPKHGKDEIQFKCRFCCSVAIWFCFGTTHFCEPCHNNNYPLCKAPLDQLVQCPCLPAPDGDRMPRRITGSCPLNMEHPKSGVEFSLGCGICRNLSSF